MKRLLCCTLLTLLCACPPEETPDAGAHRADFGGCSIFWSRDGDTLTSNEITCPFEAADLATTRLAGAAPQFDGTKTAHFEPGATISLTDGGVAVNGDGDLDGMDFTYSFTGVRP